MSEPQRLSEILPDVLRNIKRRCEQNPHNRVFNPTAKGHSDRALSAIGDFMSGRKSRPKYRWAKRVNKSAIRERSLWDKAGKRL